MSGESTGADVGANDLLNLCNAFDRNRYDTHDWCLTHDVALQPDQMCPTTATILAAHDAATADRVRREAAEGIHAEYDGYLPSEALDPAWIAGWHAATRHHAHRIEAR